MFILVGGVSTSDREPVLLWRGGRGLSTLAEGAATYVGGVSGTHLCYWYLGYAKGRIYNRGVSTCARGCVFRIHVFE